MYFRYLLVFIEMNFILVNLFFLNFICFGVVINGFEICGVNFVKFVFVWLKIIIKKEMI